ncbi:MAG: hypothetical protein HQM02_10760 [Magnetococcales bacterium]|nr:hypothetical protein [Magnetococcales bacterium]
MNILRILFFVAMGYLVYRLARYWLTAPGQNGKQSPPSSTGAPHPVGHLVRCDRCNTLIPPEAAIQSEQQIFCSEKCRSNRSAQ